MRFVKVKAEKIEKSRQIIKFILQFLIVLSLIMRINGVQLFLLHPFHSSAQPSLKARCISHPSRL
ncbi:hypothetical protein BpHYR1_013111 [Brachionus plicatilis]|uniref:Uncharacterized protein n=1 Tax=Brachionus plicatilis TaxID=10195 RepID=A0A3M7S032_BRAPC|nr:hypothetical protein BpHYR1_013111 [Brachionus plicatilis]